MEQMETQVIQATLGKPSLLLTMLVTAVIIRVPLANDLTKEKIHHRPKAAVDQAKEKSNVIGETGNGYLRTHLGEWYRVDEGGSAGELPGLGGWATIKEVSGNPTR